ncbi:MAG: ferrous iron transport protein B [Planctomycetota bacterium]|jgi:ferrous iron transport protein B|nr:ferrous iron transport protein B [Planctomycetota bacterium]
MSTARSVTREESANRAGSPVIALLGNPNTGKSTLFSALTGVWQKTANFPGATVEAKLGSMGLPEGREVTVIDLPGSYSLAATSPDERVVTQTLSGRLDAVPRPDGAVVVIDASSLERNLYIATQVLEYSFPVVIALTMVDVAEARGIIIDENVLAECLGVPVVKVDAPRGTGLDSLRSRISEMMGTSRTALALSYPSDFQRGIETLQERVGSFSQKLGYSFTRPEIIRLLVDFSDARVDEIQQLLDPGFAEDLEKIRKQSAGGNTPALIEAQARYGAIGGWVQRARQRGPQTDNTWTDRIDSVLTHRVWGSLVFLLVMGSMFQAIYAWSGPLMDGIDTVFGALGEWVGGFLAAGPLQSLIVDGVIAGVGGVLVFLPQILILFLFIAILEDLGYMARAAFLMDRLMSRFGLSGRSFIPLLSSFACAIPGIMGARVIGDRNNRMTTIFLAPFMSCSARLPVYTLMIAALIPQRTVVGFLEVQGLILLAMYAVGVGVSIPTAWVLQKKIFRSGVSPFLLELPTYKCPRIRGVLRVLWDRGGSFVRRAGTIILAASIMIWALGYFPRNEEVLQRHQAERESVEADFANQLEILARGYRSDLTAKGLKDHAKIAPVFESLSGIYEEHETQVARLEEELAEEEPALTKALLVAKEERTAALSSLAARGKLEFDLARSWHQARLTADERLSDIESCEAGELLAGSWLGQMGHAIEPLVIPLGWDWRIGMAAIASFPAREVIVATLGTIFKLGADTDETSESLREVIGQARRPDGTPLFTIATALSVMVFFALCAQCAATLAVMRRETNSWRWPIASFTYMTGLAFVASLATFQIATFFGG